jgi:hypothetical protein
MVTFNMDGKLFPILYFTQELPKYFVYNLAAPTLLDKNAL